MTILHDNIPCLLSTYGQVTGVNKYLIACELRVPYCLMAGAILFAWLCYDHEQIVFFYITSR
jgi:hypothetical protein